MKNTGFSLVELIVVIAIMAALAGVAVPVYSNYTKEAKKSVDENYVAEIWHAAEIQGALDGYTVKKVSVEQDGSYKVYVAGTGETETELDNAKLTEIGKVIPQKSSTLQYSEYEKGVDYNGTAFTAQTA